MHFTDVERIWKKSISKLYLPCRKQVFDLILIEILRSLTTENSARHLKLSELSGHQFSIIAIFLIPSFNMYLSNFPGSCIGSDNYKLLQALTKHFLLIEFSFSEFDKNHTWHRTFAFST